MYLQGGDVGVGQHRTAAAPIRRMYRQLPAFQPAGIVAGAPRLVTRHLSGVPLSQQGLAGRKMLRKPVSVSDEASSPWGQAAALDLRRSQHSHLLYCQVG